MPDIISENIVGWRVKSLVGGNYLLEPFYDTKVWPMKNEDLEQNITQLGWRGGPGVLTRVEIAATLEELLTKALEDA